MKKIIIGEDTLELNGGIKIEIEKARSEKSFTHEEVGKRILKKVNKIC